MMHFCPQFMTIQFSSYSFFSHFRVYLCPRSSRYSSFFPNIQKYPPKNRAAAVKCCSSLRQETHIIQSQTFLQVEHCVQCIDVSRCPEQKRCRNLRPYTHGLALCVVCPGVLYILPYAVSRIDYSGRKHAEDKLICLKRTGQITLKQGKKAVCDPAPGTPESGDKIKNTRDIDMCVCAEQRIDGT